VLAQFSAREIPGDDRKPFGHAFRGARVGAEGAGIVRVNCPA
jgi:hypothetical protein